MHGFVVGPYCDHYADRRILAWVRLLVAQLRIYTDNLAKVGVSRHMYFKQWRKSVLRSGGMIAIWR